MDNTNDNNQTNSSNDYQDILNQYAASVKPESEEVKPNTTKETVDSQQFLKDINNPSLSANSLSNNTSDELAMTMPPATEPPMAPPMMPTEPEITPEPSIPPMPESKPEPIVPPTVPLTPPTSEAPVPTKTPEEIKEEINKILATDTTTPSSTPMPPIKSGSNFMFIPFIIALIIFLGVAGALAYFLFFIPSFTNNSSTTSITPTSTVSNGATCALNGFNYQQGQSFPSADGCNTCTCQSQDTITCTEKACAVTPTATKSANATKSATLTPTKAPTMIPTKAVTPSPTTKNITPTTYAY